MTQAEIEALTLSIEKQFSELEIRIMSDIVRLIEENGFSTASSDWQITRLQQLGKSEEEIKKWVQEVLKATDEEIEYIFSDDVYRLYYGHERAYKINGMEQIPLKDNAQMQSLIESIKEQTNQTFRNMTNSMGFAVRDPTTGEIVYSPIREFYTDTLDSAIMDIQTGAFSYQTVLNRTVSTMVNSGVRWVDYESGYHNRVEVVARRAVLTGFRQIQGKINERVATDLGTDTYEVTYHVGARPSHQPWQGRVWTMQQLQEVCGLGTVTGLHGANCYHDYNAFIPGYSVRTYTDEQLKQMLEEENTPKEYNGKEYTTYEALQQQRKMERNMRAQRQRIKLMEDGKADEDKIMLARAKYQGQMGTYKDFSKKMKLPEQLDRVYMDGLGDKIRKQTEKQKVAAVRRETESKALDVAVREAKSKLQQKKVVEEKFVMSAQEVAEFANLKKKYKSLDEAMIFGSPDEMERYKILQKKQVKAASLNDFKIRFENQNMSEAVLNSWRESPDKRAMDAISSYSRTGYLKMNDYLRNGNYVPDKVKEEIKELADYLEKCTIESELHLKRGTDYNALSHLLGDGWQSNLSGQIGKVISDKGFLSTTPYEGGGFGGDMQMYIKAPKGTKGAYIKDYCANPDEKEFLLQRGTKLEVKNIEEVKNEWGDSQYIIHMEVMANE